METMWIVLLILLVVVALLAYTGYLSELIKKLGGALDKFHPGDEVVWKDSAQKQWKGVVKGKSGLMNKYPVLLESGNTISVDDRFLTLTKCPHANAPALLENTETVVEAVASPPPQVEASNIKPGLRVALNGRKGTVGMNTVQGVRVLWDDSQKEPVYVNQSELKILYGDEAR